MTAFPGPFASPVQNIQAVRTGIVPPAPKWPRTLTHREKMDRIAARMRAYYLTHGKGCSRRARARAARLAKESHEQAA